MDRDAAQDEIDHRGDPNFGVDRGVDGSRALTSTNVVTEDLRPRAHVNLDQRRDFLRAVEKLSEEDSSAVGIFGEEANRLLGDGIKLLLTIACGVQDSRNHFTPVRQHPLEDAASEILFAAKMIEERWLTNAHGLGDVVQ